MSDPSPTKVTCTECPFSRVVAPDDDILPAEVILEHGRETDHKLTMTELDNEDDGQPAPSS